MNENIIYKWEISYILLVYIFMILWDDYKIYIKTVCYKTVF